MSGGTINYTPVVDWLTGKAGNVYTQFGEDGLIAAIFDRIGTFNRHCFEIGAADGLFWSNTLRLRQEGWYSVLIESDASQFAKLQRDYGDSACCIHELTTDLDATLSKSNIDLVPDFGVIDIDGQDFWLWHDMQIYQPRVMLVEIATSFADAAIPARGGEGQAGLNAIADLGRSKGYKLMAHTYCNAVFLHESEA